MAPDVGELEVVDAPGQERFEIRGDKDAIGFTTYKRRGGLIAFIHTEVDPAHEGEGVASRLISGALDAARERRLAVLPFCPFVRGYIAKHPDEYLDLVPAALREHFELPTS